MKNGLDEQYIDLLKDILENGVEKETRNGKTLSVFGRSIRYKFKDGKFPLLTTKKMPFNSIVTELLWFLQGGTNIKYLIENGCNIWNGDAYKRYYNEYLKENKGSQPHSKEAFALKIKLEQDFADKWGDLGNIYGKQWRDWGGKLDVTLSTEKDENGFFKYNSVHIPGIDQIQNLINDLKTNPDSRRLMVNAWNVGELDQVILPPCHYGFQMYTRELSSIERMNYWFKNNKPNRDVCDSVDESTEEEQHKYFDGANIPKRAISLMWNQRSVDTFLGLPFNISSYGLLLEIIAKQVNMIPDQLIGNLGDTHLYQNHIEQAKEQIGRRLDHAEREELLKQAMGEDSFNAAVDDCAPFGGGLSEYYEAYKIPYRTREPFKLPTLKHAKTSAFYESLSESQSLITHLDPEHFTLENYQSHPAIKAPLSN
jgi:thymidylate synthase